MKVILLQDIENLGKTGEIKEVKLGFARNFLLPKKLAVLADKNNLLKFKAEKEKKTQQAEEELKLVQELARNLDGQEIEISGKIQEDGALFGSVSAQIIVKTLKDKGFNIEKNQVKLEKPIKEVGEYEVPLELNHGLEVKIKVIVIGGEK